MEVMINGDTFKFGEQLTLLELLQQLEIDEQRVIVEHNSKLIKQDAFASQVVSANDKLELLEFVGGG
ncbi:sulfur carrier protein ThiS [Staphylococcus kloosii]|jgi:sulfur carrier protein|uniref:Sulfur carrier protein ThiS n=1 Tax=Staphylococcus kloosii TaxID=29384 RepID=A0A151A2C3_9STAP|nr:sulfur carrier protein ThiS [Staphylococcus kloosii]AVQ35176.1 thiamine biosynthesis protein ThiS [Staphylococcus kloosii]KYH13578.1 thiamine biosynthesis protein ThiS [Staphylococcus kloosii]MBF7021110.1 sulfur carrier protein ThiS [Staphylococcus kloosii]MBF7025036.1 sulfur carrier protein ThiS [Staphylococcus kloosii]MBF7030386.1 sulfur carrier protein ThiS [Staphylococcus kloosii]